MTTMTASLAPNMNPPTLNSGGDKMDTAARQLASTMMSQLVNTMFKTMEMPHEQEMFMSFLSDAVGETLAKSGLTDDIAKSIKGQMIRIQEGQTTETDVSYNVAAQAYGERRQDDRI